MKSHKGWYRLLYPEKFIRQLDETMNSMKITNDGIFIEYKSSLELKFIRYCEMNSNITKYSLEPFPIQYIKPTDGQFHRYYIDFFVEFKNGAKTRFTKDNFIEEIEFDYLEMNIIEED